MLTHEEIRTHIHAFGLDEFADRILKSVKNAIHIGREQVEDEAIPIGASKLGGSPDVPPDFTWYTYQDTPLTFIGQFRLSEVAPHDVDHLLPERGMLYFFYETNGHPYGGDVSDATRVLYLPDEDVELRRFPHPTVKGKHYESGELTSSLAMFSTLTMIEHPMGTSFTIRDGDTDQDLFGRCTNLYYRLMRLQRLEYHGRDPLHHWFFGNPIVEQNNPVMNLMVERTELDWDDWKTDAFNAELEHWILLAQFDSDFRDSTWMWGSGGILTFCMSKTELAARDFSKVRCEMNWG